MLFDEPTSAPDPEMVNEVPDVMTDVAGQGVTPLCVTHETGFAKKIANRVIFIEATKIIEMTSAKDFFHDPQSERASAFLAKLGTRQAPDAVPSRSGRRGGIRDRARPV